MHEGNVLQFLAGEVRNKTIRFLTDPPEQALLWTPPTGGTQNHILWHAGHVVWVVDVLCIAPATCRSELPDGWADLFGQRGTPPSQTQRWPVRSEVLERLQAQLARVNQVLAGLDDQVLYRSPSGATGDTLLGWIVHGLADEAKHHGEMFLLGKLWRAAHQG